MILISYFYDMKHPVTYYADEQLAGQAAQVELLPQQICIVCNGKTIVWDLLRIHADNTWHAQGYCLRYFSVPVQRLVHADKHWHEILKKHYPGYGFSQKQQSGRPLWLNGLGFLLISLLLLLGLSGWLLWKNYPLLTDRLADRIPSSWEKQLEEPILEQVTAKYPVDTQATLYLDRFFRVLSMDSAQRCKVYVLDDSTVNAFATPGNQIFVFSGIIRKLQAPEQLAALLAHEYAHLYHRHPLRSWVRSSAWLFLSPVILGDMGQLSQLVVSQVVNLQQLKYSRDFEREADQSALQFMNETGISHQGLADLLVILEKEEKKLASNGKNIPELFRTHPPTPERINAAKDNTKRTASFEARSDWMTSFDELKDLIHGR
jgi:Zn-dependent protease with chaperone function